MKQTAGFYLPKENISMFYDAGTSEGFKVLMEIDKELTSHAEVVRIHQEILSAEVDDLRKQSEILEAIDDSQSAIEAGRD